MSPRKYSANLRAYFDGQLEADYGVVLVIEGFHADGNLVANFNQRWLPGPVQSPGELLTSR